jgi:hypothetical protein
MPQQPPEEHSPLGFGTPHSGRFEPTTHDTLEAGMAPAHVYVQKLGGASTGHRNLSTGHVMSGVA